MALNQHIYNNDAIDDNILDHEEDEEDEEEENNPNTSQPEDDDDDEGIVDDNEDEEDENNEEEEDDEDDDEEEEEEEDNENNAESSQKPSQGGVTLDNLKKVLFEGDETLESSIEKQEKQDKQEPEAKKQKVEPKADGDEVKKQDLKTEKHTETIKGSELSPEKIRENLILKAQTADNYEIVPSVAIPYGCQVHALTLTGGCKWLFTGGEDGFIRKYDFIASFEGQTPLTVAQKHSLVDSISKAGVILSYWENEQPIKKSELKSKKATGDMYDPVISPVYSLAVQNRGLWLLSGLSSGGITIQSVRHQEGAIQGYLKQHTDAVSVLRLNNSETKVLSGSWDRRIIEWDLNYAKPITDFGSAGGQISNLEFRPHSAVEFNTSDYLQDKGDPVKDDDYDSLFGSDDEEDGVKREPKREGTVESTDGSVKLTPTNKPPAQDSIYSRTTVDNNIFMSSTINGMVHVWDNRVSKSVIEFKVPSKTPPWCMGSTWSVDGERIFVGRRNNSVEEFNIKMPYTNLDDKLPRVQTVLKFPNLSGPVYTVRALANNRHLLCGSNDNIRLYDLNHESDKVNMAFQIIPGHHGGVVSNLYVDPTSRFMISTSGDRGWQGTSTETILMYEIKSLLTN